MEVDVTSNAWRTGSNASRTRCGQVAHKDKACREPKPRTRKKAAKKQKRSTDQAKALIGFEGAAHARASKYYGAEMLMD